MVEVAAGRREAVVGLAKGGLTAEGKGAEEAEDTGAKSSARFKSSGVEVRNRSGRGAVGGVMEKAPNKHMVVARATTIRALGFFGFRIGDSVTGGLSMSEDTR